MKVLLTGGAGFIGSCLLRILNDIGINDVVIVDNIASTEKWKYLGDKKFSEYINKDKLFEKLPDLELFTNVIHIGACSSTTETNFDYLYTNNFEYSKKLWKYCVEHQISFIYASSAATYGSGERGFSDENEIDEYLPLNGYGYSKQLFDLWVKEQILLPKQYVGLKFFNVYGPNEYHKGSMASVVYHGYKQVKESGKIKLFKSYNLDYLDGGQLRDFIYVKDVCNVVKYFINHPEINGLFNVGTGHAESFETLAISVFKALELPEKIEYIPMPDYLKEKYQYFTEASMNKLRSTGYNDSFYSLECGIKNYVCNYLEEGYKTY